MSIDLSEIERVYENADQLYSAAEVEKAINELAVNITDALGSRNPIIICLMMGAIVPMGLMLPHLPFKLEIDYVHATRYRRNITGDKVDWIRLPSLNLDGRTVLLVDDILDEGHTLAAVVKECQERGAAEIKTCVLVDKELNRPRAFTRADFTGLIVPDRYVFGYGMDYKGYLRNMPGIFAVKDT